MKLPFPDLGKNPSATLKVSVLLIFGLIAGIVPIAMFWQAKPRQESVAPVVAQPATANPVSALGRIEPKEKVIRLSAPAGTQFPRVERVMVKEGDRVRANQVIALLDSYDSRIAALKQAENQVSVATARLAQVKAGAKTGEINAQSAEIARLRAENQGQVAAQSAVIARLQAEWQNARSQCDRYEGLYRSGAVSLASRDSECLTEASARNQLREAVENRDRLVATGREQVGQAQANLNQIAEVRPVDVAVAQAELEQARSAIDAAKTQLALAEVRTSFSGRILKIHAHPGELVGESGVADLGQTDQMYVMAEVYQTDIPRVRVGQKATITSPVIGEKLVGTVEQVGWQLGKRRVLDTDPNLDVDAKVIEVKVRLSPEASQKVSKLSNLEVQTLIEPSQT